MSKFQTTDPKPVLRDDALYLGDNGRCLCGKHCGASARYTGRDTSGQKVARVTAADLVEAARDGFVLACETCAAQARRATGGAA